MVTLRALSERLAGPLAAIALVALAGAPALASDTPDPLSVTIPGSFQDEAGCPGDWQPECVATHLTFDADDRVWQGTFALPAGAWEYKAALDDSWDENYGANATRNGTNLALSLAGPESVKFYYDHETHWVTDGINSIIATAPGSYQEEIGCPGDWQPDCLRSWLQDPDGDGTYAFATDAIPAGSYEVKVAIDEAWSENYGAGGVQNGPNIPFTVGESCSRVEFSYDPATHLLTVDSGAAPPQPAAVTVPGSFQDEVGCPGDWQADCAATHLAFDPDDGVWQGIFTLPAGAWEYKAALNDSWDENYGAGATRNGPNLGLTLADPAAVKFYYDHASHWVTSGENSAIAVAAGSFQAELGCPDDWQPWCLRSWLQDPDGDGIFTFSTRRIPAGEWEVKVAHDEAWDENYGAGGVPGGPNIAFSVPAACTEVFFAYDAATHLLTVSAEGAPAGNLGRARAHWLAEDLIAWDLAGVQPAWSVTLHAAPGGGLALDGGGVTGGVDVPLILDPAGLPAGVREKFPHLASFAAFRLPAAALPSVPGWLAGQLAVSATDGGGALRDATSLQIPGVLDDLYANDEALGVTWAGGVPTLRVWAPTAKAVRLHRFADAQPATPATVGPMTLDPATGVWSATGDPAWNRQYYLYEVEVFVRATGRIETNLVTDPYSLSLSRNSQRSQIVDLDDPDLAPPGWADLAKPALAAPEDIVLYELHVRDFSASDTSVPASLRGTFAAFAQPGTTGMVHLAALAEAGLTHVHLLPSFDLATIDEDRTTWLDPGDLSIYPPDSTAQQAAVEAVADRDGFNWGYDPWHYTVPEGSYATEADGPQRILEFRGMVASLAEAGLRVVMDVVYNHTNASGQNAKSVLDRIVPGYYHRLDGDGSVERSTCCENTATEHAMMEKLMVDSILTWARAYRVDGFRFDLMGHHMKANMLRLRAALDTLTPEADGVDGPAVYVYGEGWNFGEVADGARGVNATQLNLPGTGIGTFSDRLRDAARGGGPFSGIREQGFLTGLALDPNATDQGAPADQLAKLLSHMDQIRVGLAGNLASFPFVDRFGNTVTGAQVDYNGQPAGYTADPQEVITYVEAHDNETLFDAIQLKAAPGAGVAERVRMQTLGLALVTLGQGIPFVHAGGDLLRSKSLDRNSFNSGDHFNRLDWTLQSNNWGVGLPPAGDNQGNWPVMAPLLADPGLAVAAADIESTAGQFREFLRIRKSSRLFRLRTEQEVIDRVRFHNTGPGQLPGVIVMSVADDPGTVDRRHELVVAAWNADDQGVTFTEPAFAGRSLALHPVQVESVDPTVRTASFSPATGTFELPGRTAAVFWQDRPLPEQVDFLIADVEALVASGALSRGHGIALRATLRSAKRLFERGLLHAAEAVLRAFVVEVRVLVRVGRLEPEAGDALIAEAAAILDQL